MFCAGYPSLEFPQKGIFTHRTALALRKHFEIEVIVLRAFNFKRPLKSECVYEGISIMQLSIPQVPHFEKGILMALNSKFLTWGMNLLLENKKLRSAFAFHSTMLIPCSMAVQPIARRFKKLHMGQAIGDDINLYLPKLKSITSVMNRLTSIHQVLCNSEALRRTLITQLPDLRKQSFVLYRGVDTDLFSPMERATKQSGTFKVLYLGGMQTFRPSEYDTLNTKGGHLVMEAWERIDDMSIDCTLTFGGPGSGGKEIVKWKSSLNRSELVSAIGVVNPKDVPDLLRNHDLVIIPSLFEGLPNLSNEAMASGVTVLGANTGGIPECITEGVTGILFERANAQDLLVKFLYLYENPEVRKKLCLAAREKIINELSWHRYAEMIKIKLAE